MWYGVLIMALVSNYIQGKPLPKRDLTRIKGIIVHRIDVGEDGNEIAKAFSDTKKYAAGAYTNGNIPYTFIITKQGEVHQLRPISEITQHARIYNTEYVGIAIVGDFTKYAPTEAQWISLVKVCVLLNEGLGYNLIITGHSHLKNASTDLNKKCPGPFLSLDKLRIEVTDILKRHRLMVLTLDGIVIS